MYTFFFRLVSFPSVGIDISARRVWFLAIFTHLPVCPLYTKLLQHEPSGIRSFDTYSLFLTRKVHVPRRRFSLGILEPRRESQDTEQTDRQTVKIKITDSMQRGDLEQHPVSQSLQRSPRLYADVTCRHRCTKWLGRAREPGRLS